MTTYLPLPETSARPRPDAGTSPSVSVFMAVRDEDLARLSPARYEHINRLGKYTFPSQVAVEPNGLRSLRKPSEAPTMGA